MPTPEIQMASTRKQIVCGKLRLSGVQIVELARRAGLLTFDQTEAAVVVYLTPTEPVVPAPAVTEEGPRELAVTRSSPVVVVFEITTTEDLPPAIAAPVPLPAEIPTIEDNTGP